MSLFVKIELVARPAEVVPALVSAVPNLDHVLNDLSGRTADGGKVFLPHAIDWKTHKYQQRFPNTITYVYDRHEINQRLQVKQGSQNYQPILKWNMNFGASFLEGWISRQW